MAEIISQVFEIDRKLTREEIDSLRECNIINAGGLPGDYRYHLHIDPITDELKKDLETRLGLRFVERRVYENKSKFPRGEGY